MKFHWRHAIGVLLLGSLGQVAFAYENLQVAVYTRAQEVTKMSDPAIKLLPGLRPSSATTKSASAALRMCAACTSIEVRFGNALNYRRYASK